MAKNSNIIDIFLDPEMDESVREEVQGRLKSRKIVSRLLAMRACAGLSQQEVSKKMGCSQGTISKFENSFDDDITLGELKRYAEIVSCELAAYIIPNNLKPFDRVKCLAFAVHKRMADMAKIAHADEEIAKAVARFFGEVNLNLFRLLGDAAGQLPAQEDGSPYFEFTITKKIVEDTPENPAEHTAVLS